MIRLLTWMHSDLGSSGYFLEDFSSGVMLIPWIQLQLQLTSGNYDKVCFLGHSTHGYFLENFSSGVMLFHVFGWGIILFFPTFFSFLVLGSISRNVIVFHAWFWFWSIIPFFDKGFQFKKQHFFFFFWLLGLKVRLRQCFCGMKDFLEHWVPSWAMKNMVLMTQWSII